MKKRFYGIILSIISFLLFSSHLYAGRPLTTEDAETIEKGKFEFEIGYNFFQNNDKTKNQEMESSLKFGITDWLDLGVSAPFIIKENDLNLNEWGKLQIKTKFSILKQQDKNPGISFMISGIPNSDQEDKRFALNSILSKNFGKVTWHLNLGTYSTKKSGKSEYFLTYSTALEYAISEKLNLCGEIVGENNDENPLEMLIGLNYLLFKNLKFDFGFGFGLNKQTYDWRITTGLTFEW